MSKRVANGVQDTWPEESAKMRTGIPAVMKYAILAMICAMAFFIRLFAVVRGRVTPCYSSYLCCFVGGSPFPRKIRELGRELIKNISIGDVQFERKI